LMQRIINSSGRENGAQAWFKVVAAVHLLLIRDGQGLL
jgi:hypothetical protein